MPDTSDYAFNQLKYMKNYFVSSFEPITFRPVAATRRIPSNPVFYGLCIR